MKIRHKQILISALTFLLLIGMLKAAALPEAKMTFVVKDDAGIPVQHTEIFISTYHHWEDGPNLGESIYKSFSARTDKDGVATIRARSLTGRFGCGVESEKYYGERIKGKFPKFKRGVGVWLPWNPTIELEAVRVLNPIPMYISSYREKWIPALNKEFGFDMKLDDIIAPYGRGVYPDFILKLEPKILYSKRGYNFDYRLKITFPNKGDGIQTYIAPKGDSHLTMPRYAPITGYQDSLEVKTGRDDNGYYEDKKDQNYFFRVRTKLDKDGKIISAHYGKIVGNIEVTWRGRFSFHYYMNPNPLDLNMEQDDKSVYNLVPSFGGIHDYREVKTTPPALPPVYFPPPEYVEKHKEFYSKSTPPPTLSSSPSASSSSPISPETSSSRKEGSPP